MFDKNKRAVLAPCSHALRREPVSRDEVLHGWSVTWPGRLSALRQLRLRADDLIGSLNKVIAPTPGAIVQAVGGLRGRSSLRLAVGRSGDVIGSSYPLD